MENTIHLRGLRFHAFHGALPAERVVGGSYRLDVSVDTDFRRAMLSDALGDTLDYAGVYAVVRREMAAPSDLMERVCGRIAAALFSVFPAIGAVRLRLFKDAPPVAGMQCEGCGVDIALTRAEFSALQ